MQGPEAGLQWHSQFRDPSAISIEIRKQYFGSNKDVLLITIYMPPHNSKYANIEDFDDIRNFILDNGQDEYYYVFCCDLTRTQV